MKEPQNSARSSAAEPAPTAPADAKAIVLRTPEQWGVEMGEIKPGALTFGGVRADAKSAAHRSAAVIHGWDIHDKHTAKPLRVTRDDYLAALKAVDAVDPDTGAMLLKPHLPACSEHSPSFKN